MNFFFFFFISYKPVIKPFYPRFPISFSRPTRYFAEFYFILFFYGNNYSVIKKRDSLEFLQFFQK